ncbi:hypothetical protein JW898_01185 [Candidatus Woesearchaeota archaeon]|nr:hypothetical protein [Candidatus Woesearchaeota archaeon]
MRLKFGKKAFDVQIHWIIIFVVFLIILILIAVGASQKSGGLLSNLFSSMRGGG